MTSDAKGRFVRALRSLDRRAFVPFVAALWAARGWDTRTDRDAVGVDIDARRDGNETRSIRVVAGVSAWSAIAHLSVWPAGTDIVVTRRRLAAAAVERVENHRSGATFEHLPADALYTRFRYGLTDAEQDRLWEEYFGVDFEDSTGFEDSTAVSTLRAVLDRTMSGVPINVTAPTSALLVAVGVSLVVVALVAAGAVSGPFAAFPSSENPFPAADIPAEATASPAPIRTPGPAPPTTTRSVAVPATCPTPPAGAHPAAIRPGVVETASTSGLEGWHIEFEWNLTDFDPNDESNRVAPVIRHLAVYETPSGHQYRLTIDRWPSAERAADRATQIERSGERASLVWGAYSIAVEPYATNAPERTAADSRKLLANVQTPGGITLGDRCVDAIGEGG